MVYIHGGEWLNGGAFEIDGSQLSAFGDVIVVVLSYRLNALGFAFGNNAFYDLIEGLKWIQQYIHNYGGDRSNVTIFGQSAGSRAVEALLGKAANSIY